MSKSDGQCIFFSIVGFVIGMASVYSGMKQYQFLQKVLNTPTSKTEGAAVGLIELKGTAQRYRSTATPISKQPCAYWKVRAEYYRSGKHGGWITFFTSNSADEFYLEDDTGKMLVDPAGAEITLPKNVMYQGYISGKGVWGVDHAKLDQPVLDYIESLGEQDKKKFAGYEHVDVRVYEYNMPENDPLYVLGTAEPREDAQASDVGCANLVVRKGNYDKVLYISDSSEKQVVERLSGGAKWAIFGGLAVAAGSLLILLAMIGL